MTEHVAPELIVYLTTMKKYSYKHIVYLSSCMRHDEFSFSILSYLITFREVAENHLAFQGKSVDVFHFERLLVFPEFVVKACSILIPDISTFSIKFSLFAKFVRSHKARQIEDMFTGTFSLFLDIQSPQETSSTCSITLHIISTMVFDTFYIDIV